MNTKVKNIKALKEFAKLYDEYKILDFESPEVLVKYEKEFSNNYQAIKKSIKPLLEIVDETDPTTPTTFITYQVITEKLVTEERYTEVQLNLKRWQEIAKMGDDNVDMIKVLSIFTGYK